MGTRAFRGLGEVRGASRAMDGMDLQMNPERSLALDSQRLECKAGPARARAVWGLRLSKCKDGARGEGRVWSLSSIQQRWQPG